MAREERILAIDIGANSIKLCELEFSKNSAVSVIRFAHREYEEELSEGTRMGVVAGLLRQMLAEGGFTARRALICMSGQSSLIRFNRMTAVNFDKKRIRQMAEFEATQNIPFDLGEIVMDYQLMPTATGDAIDVMSVVIKNDIVEQFTGAISQVGCIPILIDVASAATYNVARACGVGDDECAVILNIGGRVSNLIFAEGDKFYCRTIPIAGYTITQQISKEFGIGLPEAEELKRRHGFVALGGAYAEPESETAANVSKIIRNVMARLHGEISRTINVYRAQQKGSKPAKMYLTGGSSILTYCDTFFSEKLGIPVEYFNPFKCVSLDSSIDRNKLQEVAHMFSEVIGLGLRYATQCPIELSLIPANIRKQQNFDKKKPYFLMSYVSVILMLLIVWVGLGKRLDSYSKFSRNLNEISQKKVKKYIDPIEAAIAKVSSSQNDVEVKRDLLLQQAKMPSILNEIYRIKPDNLWITSLTPIIGEVKQAVVQKETGNGNAEGGGEMGGRGDDMFGGMAGGGGGGVDEMGGMGNTEAAAGGTVKIGGFEISGISIVPDKRGVTFSLGKAFEFPFKIESSSDDEEDEEDEENEEKAEEETEKKPADKGTPDEIMAKAMKSAGRTPEDVFLAALRNSKLFDSDKTYTDITYYKASDTIRNYSAFKIQVKMAFDLEFYQPANNAGANRGNGDEMGAGMGM